MLSLKCLFFICAYLPPFTLCVSSFLLNTFTFFANTFAGQPPLFFPPSPPVKNIISESYDFIIVGSGSSGAVLANRLSEIPTWRILLIEAGNPANYLTTIPIVAPLFQLTPYNWNFTTQPENNACFGFHQHVCAWPRGRALGGTSVINYMIYTRGNHKDYTKWANAGNPSWTADRIFPYYLKSEACNLGPVLCNSDSHNKNGLLSVEHPFQSELNEAFIAGGVELGSKHIDYNSKTDTLGFARMQATLKSGRRHNVYDAFLRPVQSRKNLKIITAARVTKIIIDPITKQTTGVVFYKNGKKFTVNTKKEVILSAGTFLSPQLLMLSGVGPESHLNSFKIPLIQNLPVGETLYDHTAFLGLSFRINQTVESKTAILNPAELLNFKLNGKGVFTSLAGIEGIAYVNTGSEPDPDYPDVELLFTGAGSLETDLGLVVSNELFMNQTIYETVFKPLEPYPTWTILPVLLHPKSKGSLKLQSRNPFDPPLLRGNYFTDSEGHDLRTFLAAIRYVQKLSKTSAMQRFASEIHTIPIPGCEQHELDSDAYWECCLRHLTGSIHHQVGTCKMGAESDPEAIVNEKLQVYGVSGLRVIDPSVIPVSLSAHTNAPAIMLGERGSDLIKKDWDVI